MKPQASVWGITLLDITVTIGTCRNHLNYWELQFALLLMMIHNKIEIFKNKEYTLIRSFIATHEPEIFLKRKCSLIESFSCNEVSYNWLLTHA